MPIPQRSSAEDLVRASKLDDSGFRSKALTLVLLLCFAQMPAIASRDFYGMIAPQVERLRAAVLANQALLPY